MPDSAPSFERFLCIAASAGSGKTFRLAHRVLHLLAQEVEPDKIAAYTFSRKAAGEIFDEIVRYLREAAEDPRKAAETSVHMEFKQDCAGFLKNLRKFLSSLHRLRIGTLDARIAQMLSAAAVELGLPPEFALIDGQGAEAGFMHEEVLDRLFLPGQLPDDAARAFLDAFEQATHGQSEKKFDAKLLDFIRDHRSVWLLEPDPKAWRHPGGNLHLPHPPAELPDEERQALAEALREEIGNLEDTRLAGALLKVIDAAAAYHPGSSWSKLPANKVTEALQREKPQEIAYYRKTTVFSDSVWKGLRLLSAHPAGVEFARACRQTLGLSHLLETFDHHYREQAFARGQITFEDACALMTAGTLPAPAEIAFRLDGEIDHWLLDEFQDTSTLQWRAIEPFADEVLQATADRSFFYVGDVKQAIYGWRGGNTDLFDQIRNDYPVIQTRHMETSQRSAPAVLDLVNTLLHDIPFYEDFPAAAVERWRAEFRPHTPAGRNRDLPGFARVVEQAPDEDNEEELLPNLLAEMLNELPEGLERAILVRSNNSGSRIANALRQRGLPAVLEGQSPLRSDTAVEVLLAAVKLAAHPGDTFSRRVLEMAAFSADPQETLRDLMENGFGPALRSLADRLALPPEAVHARTRVEKLVQAGREFDALDLRQVDRFLAFVDGYRLRDHEAAGVIRVMTIHQSKGLGFDAVFFPVESRSPFVKVNAGQLTTSATGTEPPWVLQLPPKDVCLQTGGLDSEYARLEAESAYENLCNLYVALTRAKQALTVILPPPPKGKAKPTSYPHWIRARLEDQPPTPPAYPGAVTLFQSGTPVLPSGRSPKAPPAPPAAFPLQPGPAIIPRLEPSRADAAPGEMSRSFNTIDEDGRELGSRVHDILEQLTWADEMSADELLSLTGEPPDTPAAEQVRNTLSRFAALKKPDAYTGLWKEKRFETILSDGWVTGIFDRVVLFDGAAWIQDFKTNRSSDARTVAHYAPQMQLYRRVLADMLGLDPAKIRCQLLFTRTGELREIA